MKELIKEAERLYKNIDETQSHLIKARLDKDRIREHLELIGLETIVFDAKQLLKCIIDRKDNIVDLSEVFHSVTEEPDRTKDILIDSYTVGYYVPTTISFSDEKWSHCICNYAIKRWAYIDDLLPKGGEEWSTTK